MSSKVISGDAAGQAQPIVWRRVAVAQAQSVALTGTGAGTPGQQGLGNSAEPQARIAQLQAEMSAREGQAREAGFREGEAAAAEKLEAPLKQAVARLATSLEELSGVRQRLRHEAEEDLVVLATAIARRILRRELTTDPEAILGLVKAALQRVDAREVLRVRVHGGDARMLENYLTELGIPEKVGVIADRNLERGAVIVETSRGSVDASAETQLQEIERGFADLVRRSR